VPCPIQCGVLVGEGLKDVALAADSRPPHLLRCVNFARFLLCDGVFKICVGVGHLTSSMTERLDARDVARECVRWVGEEYKNLITVVEKTRKLYGAEIQYMIEPVTGSDPVLLVGVGGSAKSVRIIAYPSRAVHLTFEKVGGVDDLLPVDHAALAAKLDVDHEFSIFRGPLVVEPDGPEKECLHGFYNPSDPAFIKAVLLELLGFNVRD
jgi:hypothetical protein